LRSVVGWMSSFTSTMASPGGPPPGIATRWIATRWTATRWIDEARSTLLTRVARARHVLEKGRALIVFDTESQQCLLMLKEQVPKELLG
jgi:hypothetical protein